MGLIRVVSPTKAGRIIDTRLLKAGFREKTQLAQLVRPGNIAASFGMRGPAEIAAAVVSRVSAIEVVRIEAGTFPVAGSYLFGDNKPAVEIIAMSGFYACKYPVTVAEVREFVEETGYEIVGQGADELKALLADKTKDRYPVVFMNKADRNAFVQWRSEKTGEHWFILSPAQQEYLRRGSNGRTYPWGNAWRESSYYLKNETFPVDVWPQGSTPDGVSGIGIVWEATRSYYGKYDPKIVKDPEGPDSGEDIEVRGGSAWRISQEFFNGAYRYHFASFFRYGGVGFRLGKDFELPESASLRRRGAREIKSRV